SFGINEPLRERHRFGRCTNLDLNCSRYRRSQFILEEQYMLKPAFITICPHVSLIAHTDQLCCYPNPVAIPAHRTLDDVLHVQFTADLVDQLGCPLVLHRRSAGDDAEPVRSEATENSDDLFGQSICKVILLLVSAEILKRQNR